MAGQARVFDFCDIQHVLRVYLYCISTHGTTGTLSGYVRTVFGSGPYISEQSGTCYRDRQSHTLLFRVEPAALWAGRLVACALSVFSFEPL